MKNKYKINKLYRLIEKFRRTIQRATEALTSSGDVIHTVANGEGTSISQTQNWLRGIHLTHT